MGIGGSAHRDSREFGGNGRYGNNINQPHVQAELDINTRFRLRHNDTKRVYLVDTGQNNSLVFLPCMKFQKNQQTQEPYLRSIETRSEKPWTAFLYIGCDIPHHHHGSQSTIVHPYVKLQKMTPSDQGMKEIEGGVYNIDWGTFKQHFGPYTPVEIQNLQQTYSQDTVNPSDPNNYAHLWAMETDWLEKAFNDSQTIANSAPVGYANNTGSMMTNPGAAALLPAFMALLGNNGR